MVKACRQQLRSVTSSLNKSNSDRRNDVTVPGFAVLSLEIITTFLRCYLATHYQICLILLLLSLSLNEISCDQSLLISLTGAALKSGILK